MVLERIVNREIGDVSVSSSFFFKPKPILGTLIGAGLSVASSVIGGIKSAQQNKKAEQEMKANHARQNAWYNRRYNEDYLDTAAGQSLMTRAKEYADQNWKRQQGAAAIGGGTDASTAMAKEAGNKMMADTMSNIASADVHRKTQVDNMHENMENQYSQSMVNLAQQRANNIAQVAGSASDAMMNAGVAFDGSSAEKSAGNVAGKASGNATGDPYKDTLGDMYGNYYNG